MTDDNVTVFTRWMRQENGADDWWNRNNPLNNGWGSGGGGGLGQLPEPRRRGRERRRGDAHPARLPGIRRRVRALGADGGDRGGDLGLNWASGHYANGGHWHYTPVDVVKAPAGRLGLI